MKLFKADVIMLFSLAKNMDLNQLDYLVFDENEELTDIKQDADKKTCEFFEKYVSEKNKDELNKIEPDKNTKKIENTK